MTAPDKRQPCSRGVQCPCICHDEGGGRAHPGRRCDDGAPE